MRTRTSNWYDDQRERPVFGVEVLVRGKWRNLAVDGKPFIADTPGECEIKRREVRRRLAVK